MFYCENCGIDEYGFENCRWSEKRKFCVRCGNLKIIEKINMPEEFEKMKKAMWVLWSWNFNPDILAQEDLDWFYNFILKNYVEEKQKQNKEKAELKGGISDAENNNKVGESGGKTDIDTTNS